MAKCRAPVERAESQDEVPVQLRFPLMSRERKTEKQMPKQGDCNSNKSDFKIKEGTYEEGILGWTVETVVRDGGLGDARTAIRGQEPARTKAAGRSELAWLDPGEAWKEMSHEYL